MMNGGAFHQLDEIDNLFNYSIKEEHFFRNIKMIRKVLRLGRHEVCYDVGNECREEVE